MSTGLGLVLVGLGLEGCDLGLEGHGIGLGMHVKTRCWRHSCISSATAMCDSM